MLSLTKFFKGNVDHNKESKWFEIRQWILLINGVVGIEMGRLDPSLKSLLS